MIDISEFKTFLNGTFPIESIWVDEFKSDLQFVEIDCLGNQPLKLAIEMSPQDIKVSTVSKRPVLDFSLYDYVFNNIEEAKHFILRIRETGVFPNRKLS